MAILKFKTRGNQTAQGKQKAYFCAHPEDYAIYCEPVIKHILDVLEKENNRNCAFYYLEDANTDRDNDFVFSLKEMNLLVMPVTTKLLTTENPAVGLEFKLAMEYGIPVLPLMMESGLEDSFNAKCGNLHFLNPNSRDATAISYEEKLAKYLTSVLVGEELSEKIRNAFDAYIFLSYRKKDRQFAQELMRLIHKNDFCRDVAIWYDEFLSPGEDFNDSIKEALEKSKLFALTVTPSLLEKTVDKNGNECDNYIVTTEYPMAQEAKKMILPTELIETDKSALANKFENIPECINVKDEMVLSDTLLEALKGIALRENDNDPEHNFFIGLAYLGGIDVEKNAELALKLITSAAESGLTEAMKKLVSIYHSGETGTINLEKAIEWQQKFVFHKRNEAQKHLRDYINALGDLGDYSMETKEYDIAEEIFNEMLVASQASDNILPDFHSKRNLATSYFYLGDIRRVIKKDDEAQVFYEKAHNITLALPQDVSHEDLDQLKKDLAITYERLGIICKKSKKWDDAKEYFAKSLELSLEVNCDDSRDLWNKAISYYHMSEAIWEGAAAKSIKTHPDPLEVSESLKYLSSSKECLEELVKQYLSKESSKEKTKAIKSLLEVYGKLSKRSTTTHRMVKRQYYGCALELIKIHLRETYLTGLPKHERTNLWNAFEDFGYANFDYLAHISQKQSELSQKKQTLLDRVDERYIDNNPLSFCTEDENIYFELGKTTQALEEYTGAQLWYTKALNCLLNKSSKSLEDLSKLITCYEHLGDCFLEENFLASRIFYRKILTILDSLVDYPASFELTTIKNRIADTFERIAHVLKTYIDVSSFSLEDSRLRKEVSNYFFKCLEIRKELCEPMSDDFSKEQLAFAYYNVYKHNPFLDAAEIKKQLESAISIWEELLNKRPYDPIYTLLIEVANGKIWENPFDF